MRQCLCLYVCRFVYLYICLFGGAEEESKMYDVIQRNGIYHTSHDHTTTQQRNDAATHERMAACTQHARISNTLCTQHGNTSLF